MTSNVRTISDRPWGTVEMSFAPIAILHTAHPVSVPMPPPMERQALWPHTTKQRHASQMHKFGQGVNPVGYGNHHYYPAFCHNSNKRDLMDLTTVAASVDTACYRGEHGEPDSTTRSFREPTTCIRGETPAHMCRLLVLPVLLCCCQACALCVAVTAALPATAVSFGSCDLSWCFVPQVCFTRINNSFIVFNERLWFPE